MNNIEYFGYVHLLLRCVNNAVFYAVARSCRQQIPVLCLFTINHQPHTFPWTDEAKAIYPSRFCDPCILSKTCTIRTSICLKIYITK